VRREAAIKSRGKWIPGVIDPAARGCSQRDGERLIQVYHQELETELLFPSANDLEAGIYECWIRLSTGRMKVFRSCQNWLAACRFHQRDDKERVKLGQADHLMDDMRYIILSGLARALVRPASMWTMQGAAPQHTSDYDRMPMGEGDPRATPSSPPSRDGGGLNLAFVSGDNCKGSGHMPKTQI
jgi:hypothetical protein